jgi:hypothetical protein
MAVEGAEMADEVMIAIKVRAASPGGQSGLHRIAAL